MSTLAGRAMRRLLTSNAFAALWALVFLGPAFANSFGSNVSHPCDDTVYAQCIADNWTHTVYLGYLGGGAIMLGPSSTAINHINTARDVSVVQTIASSRDVNVIQGSYGDVVYWAFAACADGATYGGIDPGRWCRPQVVAYNMTHPTSWWTNVSSKIGVACHELGHTLGLRHRPDTDSTCMVDPPNDSDETQLDAHDFNHLNTQYLPY